MREGLYELILLNEKEIPFQETVIGRNTFVSVEPNQEYHVKLNVFRDQNGRFPGKYLKFGLYVDGIDVQYWKRLDLSNEKLLPTDKSAPVSTCFWGFKRTSEDIRAFKFAAPQNVVKVQKQDVHNRDVHTSDVRTQDNPTEHSSVRSHSLGSVKLVVYEAEQTTGWMKNQNGNHKTPDAPPVIDPNSKFWKQASVATCTGSKVENDKEKFIPLLKWKNKTVEPCATLLLQYHLADVVGMFRENPEMLNELDSSKDQTMNKRPYTLIGDNTIDLTDDNPCNNIENVNNQQNGQKCDVQADKLSANSDQVVPPEQEIPIDDEIAQVIRKKVSPFLDLSDLDGDAVDNLKWSSISH